MNASTQIMEVIWTRLLRIEIRRWWWRLLECNEGISVRASFNWMIECWQWCRDKISPTTGAPKLRWYIIFLTRFQSRRPKTPPSSHFAFDIVDTKFRVCSTYLRQWKRRRCFLLQRWQGCISYRPWYYAEILTETKKKSFHHSLEYCRRVYTSSCAKRSSGLLLTSTGVMV